MFLGSCKYPVSELCPERPNRQNVEMDEQQHESGAALFLNYSVLIEVAGFMMEA
jgi:hypothetical protein